MKLTRPEWKQSECKCNGFCDACVAYSNEVEFYVDKLEKENQELKDRQSVYEMDCAKYGSPLEQHIMRIRDKKQFLKVVESVFKEHELKNDEHGIFGCVCEMESRDSGEDWDIWFGKHTTVFDIADESWCFFEHLLQEIKSAMEKEQNANQRKD